MNVLPKMTVPELLKNSSPGLQLQSHYSNPLAHLMSLTPSSPSHISPLAALTPPSQPHHSSTSHKVGKPASETM